MEHCIVESKLRLLLYKNQNYNIELILIIHFFICFNVISTNYKCCNLAYLLKLALKQTK